MRTVKPRKFFLEHVIVELDHVRGWQVTIQNRIILRERAITTQAKSYAPGTGWRSLLRALRNGFKLALDCHRSITRDEASHALFISKQPPVAMRSEGWFKHQDALKRLIDLYRVHDVVEVGSFLGESAIWFAGQVDRVTCVDRWSEDPNAKRTSNNLVEALTLGGLPYDFYSLFQQNVVEAGLADKIGTVRGDSRVVHEHVPTADLVYLDGDHSEAGVLADITNYRGKARLILCGDDYVDDPNFGVKRVVDRLFPTRQVGGDQNHFWWVVLDAA